MLKRSKTEDSESGEILGEGVSECAERRDQNGPSKTGFMDIPFVFMRTVAGLMKVLRITHQTTLNASLLHGLLQMEL